MTPNEARRLLEARPWLVVPAGTTTDHGPRLPLGSDTIILDRLADDLSAQLGVARAPTLEYGVSPDRGRVTGAAGLKRKTLHRLLNELVEAWETVARIEQVVILTAEANEPHQEALSTIRVESAQVQAVDILGIEFGPVEAREGPDQRRDLALALLAHLAPQLIRPEEPADGELARRGHRVYTLIRERIADRCFPFTR